MPVTLETSDIEPRVANDHALQCIMLLSENEGEAGVREDSRNTANLRQNSKDSAEIKSVK